MTTTTATRTINIAGTTATTIRCTARVDMPEYGLKVGDVFYLARSSKDNGDYYITVFSDTDTAWKCSCPATVRNCRHIRAVSAACEERRAWITARESVLFTFDRIRQQQRETEAANKARAKGEARKAHLDAATELACVEAEMEARLNKELAAAAAPLVQTADEHAAVIAKRMEVAPLNQMSKTNRCAPVAPATSVEKRLSAVGLMRR